MAEQESRQLSTEVVPQEGLMTTLMGMRRSIDTSIDMNSERGKLLYCLAMGEPDWAGKDGIGQEMVVTDYLFHTYRKEEESTGEIIVRPRLCVFTADNQVFAFSGRICIESFAMLIDVWGRPPWPNGQKVKIVQAGRGYKMVPVVIPVSQETPSGAKKGR